MWQAKSLQEVSSLFPGRSREMWITSRRASTFAITPRTSSASSRVHALEQLQIGRVAEKVFVHCGTMAGSASNFALPVRSLPFPDPAQCGARRAPHSVPGGCPLDFGERALVAVLQVFARHARVEHGRGLESDQQLLL